MRKTKSKQKKEAEMIVLFLLKNGYCQKKTSIRNLKKIIKREVSKTLKEKTNTRPQENVFEKKKLRSKKQKVVFYSKTVKRFTNRLIRIKNNYELDYLDFNAMKSAIIKSRLIGKNNPKLKFVVKRYFNIFSSIGLNNNLKDLLFKVNNYLFEKQKCIINYNPVATYNNKHFDFVFNNKRSSKSKNKRKKVRSRGYRNRINKKKQPIKVKNENNLIYSELNFEDKLSSIELIQHCFNKIAKIKTQKFGNTNKFISIEFALGKNIEKTTKADEKQRMVNSILLLIIEIEETCFNKVCYINGPVSFELFIKPEYAYAEIDINNLLELLQKLADLLSLRESFLRNTNLVIETFSLLNVAKKPIFKRVV